MEEQQKEIELAAEKAENQEPEAPAETMDDYKEELEASFKQVREGDVLTGTVIGVDEDEITVDLQSYTEGIIKKEDFTNDPGVVLKEAVQNGDEITATVVKTDDGQGHVLLSRKEANDQMAWEKLEQCFRDRTPIHVKIDGIVKGGAVAYVEESVRLFLRPSCPPHMWRIWRTGWGKSLTFR
ncbi:MAG: S1 RNA-binding domain-containing protein [Lachnospiraceae bacterium]